MKNIAKKSNHVVPSSSRWAVRKSGAERALKIFDTKSAAIAYGQQLSVSEKTELYIHKKNGIVESRSSYNSNLTSPKDS